MFPLPFLPVCVSYACPFLHNFSIPLFLMIGLILAPPTFNYPLLYKQPLRASPSLKLQTALYLTSKMVLRRIDRSSSSSPEAGSRVNYCRPSAMTPTSSQEASPELKPASLNHSDSVKDGPMGEGNTMDGDKSCTTTYESDKEEQPSSSRRIQIDLPNSTRLVVDIQISVQTATNPTPTWSPHHTQRYTREYEKFMRQNPRL